MSQLSLKKIKLGDNADLSKNFLISVPAVADGTLTIERENGTDVLTIGTNGAVTGNIGVGANQTWQVVTGSRALNTTYTNSTGRPIQIFVTCAGASNAVAELTINGVTVGRVSSNSNTQNVDSSCSVIVPNGATYAVVTASGASLRTWSELR